MPSRNSPSTTIHVITKIVYAPKDVLAMTIAMDRESFSMQILKKCDSSLFIFLRIYTLIFIEGSGI